MNPTSTKNIYNPETKTYTSGTPDITNQAMQQSGAIAVDKLQDTVTPITLPTAQPTGNIPTFSTVPVPTPTPVDTNKNLLTDYLGEVSKADTARTSSADLYAQAENQAGIAEKQAAETAATQDLANINAQIQAISDRAQAEQLKLGKERVDYATQGGASRDIQRQAAIEALPLQAQALVAQAKLTGSQNALKNAQDRLSTLFKLQSDDADRAYNTKIRQIDAVYNYATNEQKIKLDALKEAEQTKREEAKSLQASKDKIVGELIDSGQASLITELTNAKTQDEVNAVASKIVAAKTGGLTPTQINTTVNQIAGSFDNEPVVKEYNTMKNYINTFNTLGNSATDDQARIYAFAKVMDPNSVVRESEYKTVQDYSQALLKRTGINLARIFTSTGALSQEARDAMAKTLGTKLKVQEGAYNQVRNEYQRQINDAYAGKARSITEYTTPNQITAPDSSLSDDDAYNAYLQATGNAPVVESPAAAPATVRETPLSKLSYTAPSFNLGSFFK